MIFFDVAEMCASVEGDFSAPYSTEIGEASRVQNQRAENPQPFRGLVPFPKSQIVFLSRVSLSLSKTDA
jgi:hypothetical protein